MLSEQPEPTLEEVKARILSDHERIRRILVEVQAAALAVPFDDEDAEFTELTDAIWRLFLTFDDHLAYEERQLVPLLQKAQMWGESQVARLHEQHREQRTVLLAIVDEFDASTGRSRELADDARWLVRALRRDMDHEEREIEELHDDGFVANQCTG